MAHWPSIAGASVATFEAQRSTLTELPPVEDRGAPLPASGPLKCSFTCVNLVVFGPNHFVNSSTSNFLKRPRCYPIELGNGDRLLFSL
eukprot:1443015-Amphidinium_carterae.1